MPFLIGLNVWRVAGGFFLLLAAEGRLAGPFPYSAGWGDIITGALALPVAWLALRGQGKALIWAWNAFGMLDLVAALAFGIISGQWFAAANHSRRARLAGGADVAVVADLPASASVPMFLIVHGVIFARLAQSTARVLQCLIVFAATQLPVNNGNSGDLLQRPLRIRADRGSIASSYGDGKPSRRFGLQSRLSRFAAAPE